jgi:hypothetical protein
MHGADRFCTSAMPDLRLDRVVGGQHGAKMAMKISLPRMIMPMIAERR